MSEANYDELVETLQAERETDAQPPVQEWNPPLSGDIDIRIGREGHWFHNGDEIGRENLVSLFSSVIKREADEYFLVTPAEKWRIQVEDLPFYITELEVIEKDGEQALVFTSSTGVTVIADRDHPVSIEQAADGEQILPAVLVRDGMYGRISRPVYYELAVLAQPPEAETGTYDIVSLGARFPLG